MNFVEHYFVCMLSALAGWSVGRIASRMSRIPDFGLW